MLMRAARRKALWVSVVALLLLSAFAAWGCTKTSTPEPAQEEEAQETQEVENITLTLYFRYNDAAGAWLSPQQRTVGGVTDPYRAAMEELIRGPVQDQQLYPVLPNTVKVLDIAVADGLCTVDVSKEILTDANQVGVSGESEELALSAIANTLTEFPEVDKVKLLVEGLQSGMLEGRFVEDFWGHMGLPEYLERNEGLIHTAQSGGGPTWTGEGIAFGTSPQNVGSDGDGLKVASVRYYDHDTYFRVVFDIVRGDGTAAPSCPATMAEWVPAAGGVKTAIGGVVEVSELAKSQPGVGDALVSTIDFTGINGGKAEYMIALGRETPFFLHFMSDPMRIIVDLEKSPGAQPDI